ncbi:hypothetical protein [Actinomadura coerulea]|uniref:hypothetical protein n=1 Tax=Actinomadura coerulea TaxID=46159 RepID=UPI00342DAF34
MTATAERKARGRLLTGWGPTGWAAIAVAAALLAWSGWTVRHDEPDTRSGPERARDLVLRSAREQIAALNSMDPARVDAGLRAWRDASTGALHDRLAQDEPQNRTRIGQSRTTAEATVTGAAVTSLDVRAGKAKVIASVQVKLALRGGAPTLQRKRFEAGTVRTPSGWRLESLTAIPVGAR